MSGMAFVLPFVYGMDPASAFAMMIGLTSVTTTSDTFPSILLGVPGTSSSQATVVDGYPLALQGRAGHALAAAFSASMVGDRKSTRLNSSHYCASRMPSYA